MTGPPPIRWLSAELRERFGGRVGKVPLDAGFTCPNRDGSLGVGGCAWCDPGGSGPDGPARALSWMEALREGASRARGRGLAGVLAYFQAYSGTYGEPGKLAGIFGEAVSVPGVLGLAVATRPDCVGDGTVEVIEAFQRRSYLWVELGMQTCHDSTLLAMHRGHLHAATVEAVAALAGRGIRTVLHLILGLPGESPAEIRTSLSEAARLRPWGVKFHPFHLVRGSALEEPWNRGELAPPGLSEYCSLAADGLEMLHPETVVHRITGERPQGILLAPDWCRDKGAVRAAVEEELARRGTRQGARWR